jgi:hypothetical protein
VQPVAWDHVVSFKINACQRVKLACILYPEEKFGAAAGQ